MSSAGAPPSADHRATIVDRTTGIRMKIRRTTDHPTAGTGNGPPPVDDVTDATTTTTTTATTTPKRKRLKQAATTKVGNDDNRG